MTLASPPEHHASISIKTVQAVVDGMTGHRLPADLLNRGWQLVLDQKQTGSQIAEIGGFFLGLEPLDPAQFRSRLTKAVTNLEAGTGDQSGPSVSQFVLAEAVDQKSVSILLTQMLGSAQASSPQGCVVGVSALGSDWFGMGALDASPELSSSPMLQDFLNADGLSHVDQGIFASRADLPERFETLARFVDSDGNQLPAAQVLSGHESDDALAQLDCTMLARSVARMVADPALKLSVNVCRTTLRDPSWLQLLDQLIAAHGEAVQRAVFEITEWPARAGHEPLMESLEPLSGRGLALWLDDFGAGLTSFNEVLLPGIAALKVDRSLLRRCCADNDAFGVLELVAAFAQRHKKLCVIEGVENLKERKFAEGHGASHVQGFFSGRL